MLVALRSGQPFSDILGWHPRDVDTAVQILIDAGQPDEDQAREERFAAMTAELRQRMGRG
jgi:hypothetical protein